MLLWTEAQQPAGASQCGGRGGAASQAGMGTAGSVSRSPSLGFRDQVINVYI